jgi:hypothetical protein
MNYIIFFATFTVFLCEAIFHYNIGKHGSISVSTLSFPPFKEFVDIVIVLAIFSFIDEFVISYLHKYYDITPY